MPVDDLLKRIEKDKEVWDLYANGYTQGLNQCERPASTKKCMEFKPHNIVELSSFIAGIRPGFRSMIGTFCSRTPFKYGIESLDNLLKINGMTGASKDSAFLLFDEQILKILMAGGIPAAEAYACIKFIKKKKREKVLIVKEKFKSGFTDYLIKKENASVQVAHDTVEKIWKIIEDSSSYLFCASHAFCMAGDSAYCAYLKAHYPYEFYTSMLNLYTKKVKKEKIAAIIEEMRAYKHIDFQAGRFGLDNREWTIDKEHNTIYQNLSSIKFLSDAVASSLYDIKDREFTSFVDLLRCLQMETPLTTRHIETLIRINYFEKFGKRKKLLSVFDEYFNGTTLKLKVTKTLKSFANRMNKLREYESSLPDEDLPLEEIVDAEYNLIGLCLSYSPDEDRRMYYIEEVDDKYGINLKLYSMQRGTHGIMKMRKELYDKDKVKSGNILALNGWDRRQKKRYINGKRVPIPGKMEFWITNYIAA